MILGASLSSFKGLNLESAIEFYSTLSYDFGLNAVEIRFEKENGKPSAWAWEIDNRILDFLANYKTTGAHLPFIYLNPISQNPRIKEESLNQLKAGIEKASDLNMDYCVMHARGFACGLTYMQQVKEWNGIVKELSSYAKDNSIILTIENADFFSNLRDLITLVKSANSENHGLKITLDLGHAHIRYVPALSSYPLKELALRGADILFPLFIKRNMPYEEYGTLKNFIELEHGLVANVHIHDYDGKRDHITIGDGKINFSFVSELAKHFEGPYIFEVGFENHYDDFRKNYEQFVGLMRK